MKQHNFPWFFSSVFLFAVGHTSQDAWWLLMITRWPSRTNDLVFWCVLPLLAQVRGNGSLQLSEKVDENQLGVRTCRMMQTFFVPCIPCNKCDNKSTLNLCKALDMQSTIRWFWWCQDKGWGLRIRSHRIWKNREPGRPCFDKDASFGSNMVDLKCWWFLSFVE